MTAVLVVGQFFLVLFRLKFCLCSDTSEYAWSLVHLQASLQVSDTMFCNLTSQRTELIPQKAVKYEVRSSAVCKFYLMKSST